MAPPPRTPPVRDRRRLARHEQEVRQALASLTQSERLDALRDVPLSRSVQLGGPGRIARAARDLSLLSDVLEAIRSYHRPRPAPATPRRRD